MADFELAFCGVGDATFGIWHNAACIELALGNREAALQHVEAATKGGYERAKLADDAHLKPLRGDPRWVAAVGAAKAAKTTSKAAKRG